MKICKMQPFPTLEYSSTVDSHLLPKNAVPANSIRYTWYIYGIPGIYIYMVYRYSTSIPELRRILIYIYIGTYFRVVPRGKSNHFPKTRVPISVNHILYSLFCQLYYLQIYCQTSLLLFLFSKNLYT